MAAIVIISAVVLIIIVYVILKSFAFTPAVDNKSGLAKLETVNINGLDQNLLIRSENTENPVLLYLHSGPGSTEMVSFRSYHRSLEKHFTVVMWDQRGTGKSYDKRIAPETMTISQMVEDTKALTEYLLHKFKKKKLFLVGHSWGTALGLLTVSQYPEYYYAYAGSGQVVAQQEGEKISFDFLVQTAQDTNNSKASEDLARINSGVPYLDTVNNADWYADIKTQRQWLLRLGGEVYRKSDNSFLFLSALGPSEYTLSDFIKFAQGSEFSLKALWPELMPLDFRESIQQLNVPVYFLQGRHDYVTPSQLVEEYYDSISAPVKELIWFEHSAHHPMYEEPEKYDDILIQKILPLAETTAP